MLDYMRKSIVYPLFLRYIRSVYKSFSKLTEKICTISQTVCVESRVLARDQGLRSIRCSSIE